MRMRMENEDEDEDEDRDRDRDRVIVEGWSELLCGVWLTDHVAKVKANAHNDMDGAIALDLEARFLSQYDLLITFHL